MHNKNVMFAEIQLGYFHLKVPIIDLIFYIKYKIIT